MSPILSVISIVIISKVIIIIVVMSSKIYFQELSSTKQQLGHFNYN